MVRSREKTTTSSIDDHRIARLTGLIYETVHASSRWPRVLKAMADTLNAKSGLIRTLDLRSGHSVLDRHTYNLDPELQTEYQASLVGEDPYVHALKRLPTGRMVTNEDLVHLDRLCKTPYYRDYLAPQENHFIVGGFVEQDEEGRYTIMGLQRHRRARQFNRHEVEAVQRLTPHMKRAVRLERMLRCEQQRATMAESALDDLCVAALLLDRDGKLVHANHHGECLLRNEQGVRLHDGRVTATAREQSVELAARIEQACCAVTDGSMPGAQSLLLRDRGTDSPNLLAVVSPLETPASELREVWPAASVALYVGDFEDTGLLRPEVLRSLYGLTDAEARLAVAIGRGRELAELSDCWQVSVETLRSHLKSIFAKTGTNRQTELVRLLAGTPWKLATPVGRTSPP